MEVNGLHEYNSPTDEVYEFFHDSEKIKEKYEGIGSRNVNLLETSENPEGFTAKIQREVPADVPGILQKFLGAWNKVVQTEQWKSIGEGSHSCDLKVDIVGVPVSVSGTMLLRPEANGSVNDVRIKVTCGIPLVGKKLAEFVGNDTKKAMDLEYAYIKGHLPQG